MATIRKRNNSYQIRVSGGYDAHGKQIIHQKTWTPDKDMTERQVEKALQREVVLFEEQCEKGQFLDGSIKFERFSELWLKEHAEKQLRETTVFHYRKMLVQINAIIGHIKLDRIQPHHLLDCYSRLEKEGRKGGTYKPIIDLGAYLKEQGISKAELARRADISKCVIDYICAQKSVAETSAVKVSQAIGKPLKEAFSPLSEGVTPLAGKTLLNYHRLISSILETAVKWQIILANPCSRVQPPKAERKEARYLDEQEAALILEKLQGEPLKYKTIITLLLYTGMRRGEICGLSWGDIDMQNGIIDIHKSSLYLPGKGVFDDKTKNASSTRIIKVSRSVLDLLKEYRAEQLKEMLEQGTAWQGDSEGGGKVFTQSNGKPIHPHSVTLWFEKFIERHNLPSVCIHSLRHTNATLMIAAGVDLRTVSKRLGHAQMSTTSNIYAHAIRLADEMAADTLDDILNPTANASKRKA